MLALYQFRSCPFCGKVRAFMNHTGIAYDTVEVTPFGMKELDFTDHKKVPVLRDGDETIVESAAIVEYLNQNYGQLAVSEGADEWMAWIDKTLVQYLPPLIYADFKTSFKNFGIVMNREQLKGIKGFFVRLGGAAVMPRVARKMKAKNNIGDVESEFSAAIDHWVTEGLSGKDFFGGDQADQVDTSVFGVLHSARGMGIIEAEKSRNKAFATWYDVCAETMA
uniref:Glutathione S-transferase n=1 Tax=uncultured Thiotrichaceae bacterium TaxID=298394 RepID=A0A6S6SS74_9GAMM|nr:MAG: Glutathione S-transferase [uncultured Thiotrichaceae bacterium]